MKLVISVLFAVLTVASAAQADHPGRGEVPGAYEVLREARELDRVVYYSNLHPEVKRAVGQFRQAAERLPGCYREYCRQAVRDTQDSFRYAERYLYDTAYQFPQVYGQYLRTRDAVARLGYDPGQGQQLRISGRMNDRDFYLVGRSRREIDQRCRYENSMIHYVGQLFIEGRNFSENLMTLDRACYLIAGQAHY